MMDLGKRIRLYRFKLDLRLQLGINLSYYRYVIAPNDLWTQLDYPYARFVRLKDSFVTFLQADIEVTVKGVEYAGYTSSIAS